MECGETTSSPDLGSEETEQSDHETDHQPGKNQEASPTSALITGPTHTKEEVHVQPIPIQSFYTTEGSKFIAPVLRPGPARRTALRALRTDEKCRRKIFPQQSEAFAYADGQTDHRLQLRTWAFEIDVEGRRRFLAAGLHAFWRLYSRMLRANRACHFYEVIRERHAAKLYLDLEFARAFNNDLDGDRLTQLVIEACVQASGVEGDESVLVLDSTTDRKFSRHVVFEHVVFYDNLQMGDFVHSIVGKVCEQDDRVLVFKEDGTRIPFIDLGVYTRNRCFRLVGSSKFGKSSRLVPLGSSAGRLGISREEFERSLVCTVRLRRPGVKLLGIPNANTDRETRGVSMNRGMKRLRENEGPNNYGQVSPYMKLDEYVHSIITPSGGGIYNTTVMDGNDTIMYTIKGGYKFCANIGRHHKSNNVILVANLRARHMFQKCFDPDCKGFRSVPWDLPPEVFDQGRDHVDDDVLIRLMDQLEGNNGPDFNYDGGISDDLLLCAVDQCHQREVHQGGSSFTTSEFCKIPHK